MQAAELSELKAALSICFLGLRSNLVCDLADSSHFFVVQVL